MTREKEAAIEFILKRGLLTTPVHEFECRKPDTIGYSSQWDLSLCLPRSVTEPW